MPPELDNASLQNSVDYGFDNVQRGLPHQYQRGGTSSSYFIGTNEVSHKIVRFTNTTFDTHHVELTYRNQAIPSPYGMQALELVDLNNPVSFLLEEQNLPLNAYPDFSGEKCVISLIRIF